MKLDCRLQRHTRLFVRLRLRARRFRGESGSTLMEFAFVIPMLMTVLTGAASFSLAFYNLQQLGNATATAVQAVAAEQGLASDDDPCAYAATTITGALPSWTASKFTYTEVITDNTGTSHKYGPTTGNTFSCSAGSAFLFQNYPVVLTVSYSYSWLPILAFSPKSPLTAVQAAMAD